MRVRLCIEAELSCIPGWVQKRATSPVCPNQDPILAQLPPAVRVQPGWSTARRRELKRDVMISELQNARNTAESSGDEV